MAKSSGRIFVNKSVSFDPEMLAQAKKRAANLGLRFSTYVQKCVERDLAVREAIVFEEKESFRRKARDGT